MSGVDPVRPTPATIDAQIKAKLAELDYQRARGNTLGIDRLRRQIDSLLEKRNVATGPPVCGCGRPKATYGTAVHLCPECDFRECQACRRRIESLIANVCPHCGAIEATPKAPAP